MLEPSPSGFRKSLNPIYSSSSSSGDHTTTGSSSSTTPTSSSSATAPGEDDAAPHADVPSAPSAAAPAALARRHTGGEDGRWPAIRAAEPPLSLGHFRLVKRLGYGDIGSVYLVELRGAACGRAMFAMKVMDKGSLAGRNKLARAQTEREILGLLDHPFLPTLYSHFETDKFCCLLMEYCSGDNLHSLRQKQPNKRFTEDAARQVFSTFTGHGCKLPRILPSKKSKKVKASSSRLDAEDDPALVTTTTCRSSSSRKNPSQLEFTAEPTGARSMSFVGMHEYLAPEIIRGEGHGSAVDWWTFRVFLY